MLERLDTQQVESVQRSLTEVGAKLSDVYGADRMLWVEGRTEEECFRLIASKLLRTQSVGTIILAVRNTGDFDGKRKTVDLVLDIYESLNRGSALIPPAVGFLLDRETRSETEISDVKRRSSNLVKFLPRRTYENYLLNVDAIAAMLAMVINGMAVDAAKTKVEDWLRKYGLDPKYFAPDPVERELFDPGWMQKVNAPKLLYDMTQDISDSTVEYRKVIHSVALTDHVIDFHPDELLEVGTLLKGLLQ